MKQLLSFTLVVITVTFGLLLVGCQKSPITAAATYSEPAGTYVGKGKFSTDAGSMDLDGTLTLNADQSYKLQYSLGMLGLEVGTWKMEGSQLTLSPNPEMLTGNDRGTQALRAMSNAKQPKTWSMEPGFQSVSLSDGPMQVTLKRQ
jgi:hypothetical protein